MIQLYYHFVLVLYKILATVTLLNVYTTEYGVIYDIQLVREIHDTIVCMYVWSQDQIWNSLLVWGLLRLTPIILQLCLGVGTSDYYTEYTAMLTIILSTQYFRSNVIWSTTKCAGCVSWSQSFLNNGHQYHMSTLLCQHTLHIPQSVSLT